MPVHEYLIECIYLLRKLVHFLVIFDNFFFLKFYYEIFKLNILRNITYKKFITNNNNFPLQELSYCFSIYINWGTIL